MPAEPRPWRSPRTARGGWHDRPIAMRPSLASTAIHAFISDVLLFLGSRFATLDEIRQTARVSVSSHHGTSAQAYLLGRRHVDNDRVLSPAGAFCQILARSLGRIICALRSPVTA